MAEISRKAVFVMVGTFAKAVTSLLNNTSVHNADTLLRLVRSRPSGVPLITVSNHMSTLDDPLMWGFKGFPIMNAKLFRWVLAAEDICFRNSLYSHFFRSFLNEQLHTFPEGKVNQEIAPVRRLKWGTASLIVRSPVTPIVLPIVHRGFQEVMPENYRNGKRPRIPLTNKNINIIVGEPIEFDIPKLCSEAASTSNSLSFPTFGWPKLSCYGLDEAAQKCLYMNISEQLRTALQRLLTHTS
ncbi:N-acylphosphatidylethanolamine synthase [Linum perenne]